MKIERKSPFSGKQHTQEIPVTAEQIRLWEGGMLIQNAMPQLTADQREFVMTGITSSEWTAEFGNAEHGE